MLKKIYIMILIIFNSSYVFGNNNVDEVQNQTPDYEVNKDKLKAIMLSGIFSGAGQFYMKNYRDGIIYSSIEVLELLYRKKTLDESNDYTIVYKNFADTNWAFSNWIENYYTFNDISNPLYNGFIYTDANNNTSYKNPWDQSHGIQFNYNNISYNTSIFNEQLDNFLIALCGVNYIDACTKSEEFDNLVNNVVVVKNHHHYEGIGKYNLFFAGWDDATSGWLEEGIYNIAQSNLKKTYEDELRYKSKKKHDMAENMLALIFINHVVSMLDILVNFNGENNMKINSDIYLIDNEPSGKFNFTFSW